MSEPRAPYPAWIYDQSAVLPYRAAGTTLEVLLITSRGGKRWLLPKGIVEPGMTAQASARKEAREEAGVDGVVDEAPLGEYRYRKWGGACRVRVYPMQVMQELDDWPEARDRQRCWLTLADAARRIADKSLRALVERLPAAVTSSPAQQAVVAAPPPRLVYLLRHAKSSWKDTDLDDRQRPLAPRGERACEAMGRYIRLADVHPARVTCSDAVRTRQTLERVSRSLGEKTPVRFDPSLYLADTPTLLARLRDCEDGLRSQMLIAHNPGMHELALRLTGSGEPDERARLASKFPTGALAILVYRGARWAELDDAACELHSHVWPREIGDDPASR